MPRSRRPVASCPPTGGRSSVGKVLAPEQVPEGVAAFVEVAGGRSWEDAGLGAASPRAAASDIRNYYEESAVALAGHVPRARQAQAWFRHHTETGRVLVAAQAAMKASGADEAAWGFILPRP